MDWKQHVHSATPSVGRVAGFGAGDEIRVWYRILEQGKERFGQFEGMVIRVRGEGPSATFTVRRVTFGEGVERIFPMDAKAISRIEVLRKGHVKRSRLYFLRTLVGKSRIASIEGASTGDKRSIPVPIINKTAEAEAPVGPSSTAS